MAMGKNTMEINFLRIPKVKRNLKWWSFRHKPLNRDFQAAGALARGCCCLHSWELWVPLGFHLQGSY